MEKSGINRKFPQIPEIFNFNFSISFPPTNSQFFTLIFRQNFPIFSIQHNFFDFSGPFSNFVCLFFGWFWQLLKICPKFSEINFKVDFLRLFRSKMAAAGPGLFFSPKIAPGRFRAPPKRGSWCLSFPFLGPNWQLRKQPVFFGGKSGGFGVREKNRGKNSAKFWRFFPKSSKVFKMLEKSAKIFKILKSSQKFWNFWRFRKFLAIFWKISEMFCDFLKDFENFWRIENLRVSRAAWRRLSGSESFTRSRLIGIMGLIMALIALIKELISLILDVIRL